MHTTYKTAGTSRLPAALDRLAALARFIEDFAEDLRSEHRIVYVFDTDMIVMYSRAEKTAFYCALLRDEVQARRDFSQPDSKRDATFCTTETLLAEIIGNHIVWTLDDPALSSPAHADELIDVSNAIVIGAARQESDLRERLHEKFSELAASNITTGIDSHIDDILSDLDSTFPHIFQALRLEAAFKDGRIHTVDGYHPAGPALQDKMDRFPSGLDSNTGDFNDDILRVAREIEKVLVSRAKASEFNTTKTRADSRALAYLCWLNQQLERSSQKARVRFVTGAHQIHRLRASPDTWQGHVPTEVLKIFRSFAPELRTLIRHPLGYVDSIFDTSLRNWLGERLLTGTPENTDHEKLVESTAKELEALLKATRARQSVSPDRHWLHEILVDVVQGKDWDTTLAKRLDVLVPRFLASLAVLQRPTPDSESVSRNLPPLAFHCFSACDAFCKKLYAAHASTPTAASDVKKHLEKVIASDSSHYTPFIALALWRAADRDWARARVMAKAAVEMAKKHIEEQKHSTAIDINENQFQNHNISGEEANYLYAVTLRLTAGSKHWRRSAQADLEDALKAIDQARESLKVFNLSRGAIDTPDHRHDSEEISIRLTMQLFARLARQAEIPLIDERQLFNRAWHLFEEHLSEQPSTNRYQYEYILQQLCVSMAQLYLLDRYAVSGQEIFPIIASTWSSDSEFKQKTQRMFELFDSQCNHLRTAKRSEDTDALPVASSFVELVRLTLHLDLSESISAGEAKRLREDLKRYGSSKHRLATIDDVRFNFLVKISERRIGRA